MEMWKLILLFTAATAVCHGKKDTPPKQFSDTYSAKGTLQIPYAEISEPFYAWFDLEKGASRIDYYGGMVKTYQLAKPGISVKIAPITTEKIQNVETCLILSNGQVSPQSVLPDISDFEYMGEDMVHGLLCNRWSKTNTYGAKVNKYTMWTRSNKGLGMKTAVPVKYEMKGYNTLLGSHYDHYYLEYEFYSVATPNNETFDIANYSCSNFQFSGAERDHIYTFNPMKEFIHNYDKHIHSAFEDFKDTYGKNYDNEKEISKRLDVFRQNLRFIHSHNRARRGYQLAVNHLADRDDLELRALRGNLYHPEIPNQGKPFPYSKKKITSILKTIPESLDWRLNGAVTPVKDQSVCGSCWAFGTTGAIEGAYFLKTGNLLRFSPQALVDCSWGFGNYGCDGGEDHNSYDWIIKHDGLPTEDDYGSYIGQDGYCHVNKSMHVAKIKDYVNVTSGDFDALKVALAVHGPISVAIDASLKTFSFYSNGVYYDPKCSSKLLDHAVVLVGYGKLNGEDYWLIKNSWSNLWGNDGYILISQKKNNCGVATDPTFVIM